MPRKTALESPGCPPLRAMTTDSLGLIKVIEARERAAGAASMPKVVETWGTIDASGGILLASLADRKQDPILAVGRKNGVIDFLNPINGVDLATISMRESSSTDRTCEVDSLAALHVFKRERLDDSSMLGEVLMCTKKGKACIKSVAKGGAELRVGFSREWNVCSSGEVLCSSVNASEEFALFGGKGVEINLWDINTCSKLWTSKSPPPNKLGLCTPTWFTAGTFLCKDDHRKIVAGNRTHQIRLYDTSSQRRPVTSIDFRESPITVVSGDLNGYSIYVGTGTGDLARFDMRTGRMLGSFVGKCSGSIKSIARHPNLPIIASCGLDRFLRIWNVETRQLLSAVFLKQHVSSVVFDSHFSVEDFEAQKSEEQHLADEPAESEDVEDEEPISEIDGEFDCMESMRKKSKHKACSSRKRVEEQGMIQLRENDGEQPGEPISGTDDEVEMTESICKKSKHKARRSKKRVEEQDTIQTSNAVDLEESHGLHGSRRKKRRQQKQLVSSN